MNGLLVAATDMDSKSTVISLATPRDGLLPRVHVHPQQVAVGEPIHERSVESDLMVVTVGIVEKRAEATTNVGGVLFAVGEAFRGHAPILGVSARPPRMFACSLCHDCPHPGPDAITTKATPHEHIHLPEHGPCSRDRAWGFEPGRARPTRSRAR